MQNRSDVQQSLLLIRLSSLGDVLLSTPIVRMIHTQLPSARLDVAVASAFADVYRWNPHVHRVIEIDKSRYAFAPLFGSLSASIEQHYDAAVDLQNNIRSLVLRKRFAQRALVVNSYREEKRAMVHGDRARSLPHVVQRYLDVVRELGIEDDGEGLEYWLPTDDRSASFSYARAAARDAIRCSSDRRIVLAPGAQHLTKRWDAASFATLADGLHRRFGVEIDLVGAADDRAVCEEVHARSTAPIRNYAGTRLAQSAEIMDKALLVVSNDSGAMHLAAARRVPVVSIFGSTVPELGFAPYGVPAHIVQSDVDCRPCTHIGRSSCPKGHLRCLKDISVPMVEQSIASLLAEQGLLR